MHDPEQFKQPNKPGVPKKQKKAVEPPGRTANNFNEQLDSVSNR